MCTYTPTVWVPHPHPHTIHGSAHKLIRSITRILGNESHFSSFRPVYPYPYQSIYNANDTLLLLLLNMTFWFLAVQCKRRKNLKCWMVFVDGTTAAVLLHVCLEHSCLQITKHNLGSIITRIPQVFANKPISAVATCTGTHIHIPFYGGWWCRNSRQRERMRDNTE